MRKTSPIEPILINFNSINGLHGVLINRSHWGHPACLQWVRAESGRRPANSARMTITHQDWGRLKPFEAPAGLVGLGRFELPTHGLGNRCSIHLSYRPASPQIARV